LINFGIERAKAIAIGQTAYFSQFSRPYHQ
jgi:hypothetical protein